MSQHLFTTTTMMGVVQSLKTPSSFLLDMFFGLEQISDTEEVVFDVRDGARRLAPFVSPLVAGAVQATEGHTTKKFKPAYLKPKEVIDPSRPVKRVVGERIGGEMAPTDRAQLLVGNLINEQIDQINRRLEVMASEVLTTGKVTISGEQYATQVVDFGRDTDHTITLTSGSKWGETGVDPLEDLDAWAMLILKRTGSRPNQVVMGTDAWAVFKKSPSVESRLDVRRVGDASLNLGGPDSVGGTYMGTVDGFDIYVYADWYIDPADGQEKPVLPTNQVVMASRAMQGTRAFGAILDAEAGYRAMPYFPKSWIEEDPSVRYVMTQSAPLLVPTRPNASLAATVR